MIGQFLIETDWKRRPRQRRSLLRRKKRGDRQNLKIQKKKFKDQVQKQNKTILAVSKYLQMPQNYYCKWLKMFAETSKLLLQVGQNICRCLKMEENSQKLEAAYSLVVKARAGNLEEIGSERH